MEINKQALSELLLMNDDEFNEKISLITEKLGISGQSVSPTRVRSMLKSMSESDLYRLMSSLGDEKTSEILNILKGGR